MPVLPQAPLSRRFTCTDTLPAGVDGDVYIMRQICHDWPNADVVRILTGIRTAMNASAARLVIIEVMLVPVSSCLAGTMDPALEGFDGNNLWLEEPAALKGINISTGHPDRANAPYW